MLQGGFWGTKHRQHQHERGSTSTSTSTTMATATTITKNKNQNKSKKKKQEERNKKNNSSNNSNNRQKGRIASTPAILKISHTDTSSFYGQDSSCMYRVHLILLNHHELLSYTSYVSVHVFMDLSFKV